MTARILLVPGFWLGAWAWDEVADDLRGRGHEVRALTLPGLDPDDPDRLSATFERQAAAIIAAATEPTVLVSHSGGAAPAYLATDIAPERFSRAIYVDTAPLPDGHVLIPTLSPDVQEFRMPSWPEVEANGSSLADLDDAMLHRFRDRAVSEPIAIATAPLRLSNSPARLTIPTTLICSSFSSALVRKLRDEGAEHLFTELSRIDAEYIDLPTGHWPMWSRPTELAELIHTIANR
ncbi:alpha/beta fold hydrolase [Nocardia terpenica]|uniref:Alpha/beta fold hydrolase n=1 Tax=Nocardia terpenica TaxID=455432 RepID=A0A6G9Z1D8_9NOCA|nr:alpha/beta hydrolase [Nocardia terpenica]QIS19250.1 alpha/beta fold hydrolase [Nocardia terpenica]